MKTELKPCPFCGGKAKFDEQYKGIYVVRCSVCGIGAMESAIFAEPEELIGAWNRRVGNDMRKELEKMNYMEKIADMLDVELGERFKIKELGFVFYIDTDGFFADLDDDTVYQDNARLVKLLTGEWKIEKLPWKPKNGEIAYYIDADRKMRCIEFSDLNCKDLVLYKLGKLYRTKEEAEAHAEEDKAYWNEIRKELEE